MVYVFRHGSALTVSHRIYSGSLTSEKKKSQMLLVLSILDKGHLAHFSI